MDTRVNYSLLKKATVEFEYLHTNSTTHEFLFGAVAELVDNSRDANATSLHIDFDEEVNTLSFRDDGVGMTPEETTNVVCFGYSLKRLASDKIGQYGNGLKSGALRTAKDFMIFTKKSHLCTALLLSRTFHEKTRIKDILVPAPAFDDNFNPISDNYMRYNLEMNLIYQYSPFKTKKDIKEQFDKIDGEHGTIIVLFNLRRLENGRFELDFDEDKEDIGLSGDLYERKDEMNSLRAYLSVLYLSPYTKIYLRGKKVDSIRVENTLGFLISYEYHAKNLKSCAEKEYEECVRHTAQTKEDIKAARSQCADIEEYVRQCQNEGTLGREEKTQQQRINLKLASLEEMLKECKQKEARAKECMKTIPPLTFTFGMNLHHRNRYGCLIYNNGRLIGKFVKMAAQKESTDIYMRCLGVVGIVDIPYSVLTPTHNKQSFENEREYKSLLSAMNNRMEQYWEELCSVIGKGPNEVKNFWKPFGYNNCCATAEPSDEIEFKRNRFRMTNHCIQCDFCLKWRFVEYQEEFLRAGIPPDWKCTSHPKPAMRNCDKPENISKCNHMQIAKFRRNTRESLSSLVSPSCSSSKVSHDQNITNELTVQELKRKIDSVREELAESQKKRAQLEEKEAEIATIVAETEAMNRRISEAISKRNEEVESFTGVYRTEDALRADILAFLNWVNASGTHKFSQEITPNTAFPMFKEFCEKLREAEDKD